MVSASPSHPLRGPACGSTPKTSFEASGAANGCGWQPSPGQKTAQRFGDSGINGTVTNVSPRLQQTMTYTHHDSFVLRARFQGTGSTYGYLD